MLLASFASTRPGFMGLGNILIRFRLSGPYSHTEVVFEPGDGVDDLMPDGTCQPDATGALWTASSVAWSRMPAWSRRRAGKRGGVRFERQVLDPAEWNLQPYRRSPVVAATAFRRFEGRPYDWRLIVRTVSWVMGLLAGIDNRRFDCAEIGAEAGRFPDAWRFDPCSLQAAVAAENAAYAALASAPISIPTERQA